MSDDNEFRLIDKPSEVEAAPTISTPIDRAYDPSQDRERKRGQIALSLVGLLAAIAAFSLIFVMFAATKEREDAFKGVLELPFGPIVGLVGAVTGFYFGAKSKD
jgi:hypothetical protein